MAYKPTENELQILHILWERGASSVRDVHEILSVDKESGYTTTLKLMQIMADKEMVTRDTSARTHIYQAAISETSTKDNLVRNFLSDTFRGSASKLVMQVLGGATTTSEELEEIKAMIDQIQNQPKQ